MINRDFNPARKEGRKEGEISVDVCVFVGLLLPRRAGNISISLRGRSVSQPVRGVLTPGVELHQDVDQVGGEEGEVAGGGRDHVPLTARIRNLRVVSQPVVQYRVIRSGQVRSGHLQKTGQLEVQYEVSGRKTEKILL